MHDRKRVRAKLMKARPITAKEFELFIEKAPIVRPDDYEDYRFILRGL